MGVEALGGFTAKQRRYRGRNFRVDSGGRDFEPHRFAGSDWIDGQRATAGDCLSRDGKHVEQELDPILLQQRSRQVPGKLRLFVLQEAARYRFRIAKVDLRARRTGGAEGDAAKLQFL